MKVTANISPSLKWVKLRVQYGQSGRNTTLPRYLPLSAIKPCNKRKSTEFRPWINPKPLPDHYPYALRSVRDIKDTVP